jgi:hypothetical protein
MSAVCCSSVGDCFPGGEERAGDFEVTELGGFAAAAPRTASNWADRHAGDADLNGMGLPKPELKNQNDQSSVAW